MHGFQVGQVEAVALLDEEEEESAAVDALVEAAKHGRVEKVKRALRDSGGAAKDWRKANGFTPLMGAAGACTINRPLITMHD